MSLTNTNIYHEPHSNNDNNNNIYYIFGARFQLSSSDQHILFGTKALACYFLLHTHTHKMIHFACFYELSIEHKISCAPTQSLLLYTFRDCAHIAHIMHTTISSNLAVRAPEIYRDCKDITYTRSSAMRQHTYTHT